MTDDSKVAPTAEGDELVDRGRAPRGILVLAFLIVLQGLFLALLGGVVVAVRPELDGYVGGETGIVVIGAALLMVGLVRITLGVMVVRGSDVGRFLLGLFAVLQIALTTYSVVALREADTTGLVGLALAIVELWLLYGFAQTEEYFRT